MRFFDRKPSVVEATLRAELERERQLHDEIKAEYRDVVIRRADLVSKLDRALSQNAQVLAQLATEQRRYDDLLRLVTEMRREGFNPPSPVIEPVREESVAMPPEVNDAIRDIAGDDASLRQILRTQASSMLADDMGSDDVAKALRSGSSWNPLI